ncbi:MAG: radical SAM protein [Candidatus Omnitrophica bacterium]|nr:radical SAM protein [Candidatus Omnitrophota bacterium]
MMQQVSRKNKIRIVNLNPGCEPSGILLNKIVMFLRVNGYEYTFDTEASCDVVLINSCCVSNAMMSKMKIMISETLEEGQVKKVIIFGCFVPFAEDRGNDARVIMIGPKEAEEFDQLFAHRIPIGHVPAGRLNSRLFRPHQLMDADEDYFVLICQGCTQNCSYCNIKRAKGRITSRSAEQIIKDIQQGLKEGKKNFVLVGDDCGSYGVDLKTDLACLVREIIDACPDIRLKINYVYPGRLIHLFPSLAGSIVSGKIIYMCVPLQSGSKRILKLMNRDYDLGRLRDIVTEIKKIAPSLWIYTHMIVNFPTETMEDLEDTLQAAEWFDDFVLFNYSDNPMTAASRFYPKVEGQEQAQRLRVCMNRIKNIHCGRLDQI